MCFIEKWREFYLAKKESWQISKFGTDKIPGEYIFPNLKNTNWCFLNHILATFKTEQGEFNFDLDPRVRMSPASHGLMSPAHSKWTLQPSHFYKFSEINMVLDGLIYSQI
jgi:hypothetical protein